MLKTIALAFTFAGVLAVSGQAQELLEKDVLQTSAGELEITFIGHGSLLFVFGGKNIYVDPYGKLADYGQFPKADLVLLTHAHRDHLDPEALAKIETADTSYVVAEICAGSLREPVVMKNGETKTIDGMVIEAVPAYNIVHKRDDGLPYHPKGEGNGYVISFGDKRVYIAGDTENVPEMSQLQDIDCAFLPMNLPYTMTPEMAAAAARQFQPAILYPYHYGTTDTKKLIQLLADDKKIEVRIRNMQ